MSDAEATPNKKRKQNFSASECSLIVELVEKDLEVLRGKHSNVVTNARKQKLWKEITLKVNSLGYAVRTPTEIREKWRNLSQYAKKTNSGLVKSRGKTGGGPSDKSVDTTTAKIINLLRDEPSFSGIPGGFETGVTVESISDDEDEITSDDNEVELVTLNMADIRDNNIVSAAEAPVAILEAKTNVVKCVRKRPSTQAEVRKDVQELHKEVLSMEKEKIAMEKENLILKKRKLELQIRHLENQLNEGLGDPFGRRSLSPTY